MRFIFTIGLILLLNTVAFGEMRPYNTDNPSTGIEAFDYAENNMWVDIKFKNSQTTYRYPRSKYGDATIQMMIDLAKNGKGLNSYINTLPRKGYRRKQELPETIVCGPQGGYPKNEWWHFPIQTRGQARAALSYAHWAPNPEGIRQCVCEHFDFPSCKKYKQ